MSTTDTVLTAPPLWATRARVPRGHTCPSSNTPNRRPCLCLAACTLGRVARRRQGLFIAPGHRLRHLAGVNHADALFRHPAIIPDHLSRRYPCAKASPRPSRDSNALPCTRRTGRSPSSRSSRSGTSSRARSGPSGSVGFVHFASPSALMVLDHFLFFYVSVFLAISIVLAALARERVGRVMKVMTPAWVLVLIPPFLDHLLTGGHGTRITYLTDLSSVFLRFFDPKATFERVSQGQRVEILAACLLALSYVRMKTRSWLRAVVAFAAVYVVLALHGILPMAYARLTGGSVAASGASPEILYRAAFKSGGIVPDESRKLALLFLLTSSLLGWAAYAMHAPAKARALLRNTRPLRSVHYVGMAAFGIACGWALASPVGVGFSGGGDVLGVLGICLATFLAFQGSVALNDLFDEEGDRLVGAPRPLVTGSLDRGDVAGFAAAASLAALLFALNVKYSTFLLIVLALAVSFIYSAPPLRLKRVPLLATLLLGCVSLLACLGGFTSFAEERATAVFPLRLGWTLVLAFGLGFSAKDLKDVEGDRATGVLTMPVLLGPRGGRIAVAALVLLGYLIVPVLLPFRALVAPALVARGRERGARALLAARPAGRDPPGALHRVHGRRRAHGVQGIRPPRGRGLAGGPRNGARVPGKRGGSLAGLGEGRGLLRAGRGGSRRRRRPPAARRRRALAERPPRRGRSGARAGGRARPVAVGEPRTPRDGAVAAGRRRRSRARAPGGDPRERPAAGLLFAPRRARTRAGRPRGGGGGVRGRAPARAAGRPRPREARRRARAVRQESGRARPVRGRRRAGGRSRPRRGTRSRGSITSRATSTTPCASSGRR